MSNNKNTKQIDFTNSIIKNVSYKTEKCMPTFILCPAKSHRFFQISQSTVAER